MINLQLTDDDVVQPVDKFRAIRDILFAIFTCLPKHTN